MKGFRRHDPQIHGTTSACGQLPPVTAVSDIRSKEQTAQSTKHRAKRRPDDHQDIARTGFRKGETGSPPPTAKKEKEKKTKIRVRAEATGRVLEREKLETPLDTDDYWLEFPLALPGHQTRLNSALRSVALRNWGEIVSFLGKSDSLSNWGYNVYFLCLIAQGIQGILLNAVYVVVSSCLFQSLAIYLSSLM